MAFVPVYILILGFTIIVDYFAGIAIEESRSRWRRIFLVASLVANVGVLAVFKYYNFIVLNLTSLLNSLNVPASIPYLSILLPIGLSFHTFQAMSYTIEVYRGNQKAERKFGIYALYVMFYPQLVAGPIERPQNLLHQFYKDHSFDYQRVVDGLKLMGWGLFKKIVIADRLALVVDNVFSDVHKFNGPSLAIGVFFFAFQIFCDFSGYSDIAIGAAQVMGFKLMTNFRRPYLAKSIAEFWTRWHISLSTWFRDYLYIPLGGNRVSMARWNLNLFIVFIVSGIWHGANWTFVAWGTLHGLFLVTGNLTRSARRDVLRFVGSGSDSKLLQALEVFVTFLLVSFAWIFFRANSIGDALYVIRNVFVGWRHILNPNWLAEFNVPLGVNKSVIGMGIVLILFMGTIHYFQEKYGSIRKIIAGQHWLVRWSIYYCFVFLILFLRTDSDRQFIYFQF